MTQENSGKWMTVEAFIASGALSHFESPNDSAAALRRWAAARGLTHILPMVPKRGYAVFRSHLKRLSKYPNVIDHLFSFKNKDGTKFVVTSQPYHDNIQSRIDTCHVIAAEVSQLDDLCVANYCLLNSWWYPGRTGTLEFWLRGAP